MAENTRERAEFYPAIESDPTKVAELFRDKRWHGLDDYWRPWHRLVEKNIRMVAGRHWDVYLDILGKFVDITTFMTDEEKAWRQRPVFNRIGYWYHVTHAKLTENPPQVAFLPSSADRKDAILAEIMDPLFKDYLWEAVGMPDKHDFLMRWVCAAGRGVVKSYWDERAGELQPMIGPALVTGPDGQPIQVPDAPYGYRDVGGEKQLVPLIEVQGDQIVTLGDPLVLPTGEINVDVLSPLEVRSSPEPVPEWEKRWKVQRGVMHVDEVKELYDIQVEPDVEPGAEDEIAEILFGLGNMGAVEKSPHKPTEGDKTQRSEGFVWVYEGWERQRFDVDGMDGGRHVVVVGQQGENVAIDEPIQEGADYWPIHEADFIGLPGRPVGKSPVEDMTPINRAYNRGGAQILEHRALMTNPIWVGAAGAGIEEITNEPGQYIEVPYLGPGVKALEAITPPPLGTDVWRTQEWLKAELEDMGSLREGSEGGSSPRDPRSGELIKELRFNDDRFIGPAATRVAVMYARMVQDAWIPLLREGWDQEKIVRVSGEQNRARFLTVQPEMFQGRVNVKPVPESMLPEGRDERQRRIERWYGEGHFGPPGTPEAEKTFFDLINYPHMGRAAQPGGVDREMAEYENAQMLQGIEVYPLDVHNGAIHLEVHRQIEASPDFLKYSDRVQQNFVRHRMLHEAMERAKALQTLMQAKDVQDAIGQDAAPAEGAGAATEGA